MAPEGFVFDGVTLKGRGKESVLALYRLCLAQKGRWPHGILCVLGLDVSRELEARLSAYDLEVVWQLPTPEPLRRLLATSKILKVAFEDSADLDCPVHTFFHVPADKRTANSRAYAAFRAFAGASPERQKTATLPRVVEKNSAASLKRPALQTLQGNNVPKKTKRRRTTFDVAEECSSVSDLAPRKRRDYESFFGVIEGSRPSTAAAIANQRKVQELTVIKSLTDALRAGLPYDLAPLQRLLDMPSSDDKQLRAAHTALRQAHLHRTTTRNASPSGLGKTHEPAILGREEEKQQEHIIGEVRLFFLDDHQLRAACCC